MDAAFQLSVSPLYTIVVQSTLESLPGRRKTAQGGSSVVREEQPEEETVEARRFFRPGCGDSGMAKTFVATFKT